VPKFNKLKKLICLAVLSVLLLTPHNGESWGFFAHRRINRLAVFCLPPEMIGFYKHYIVYLTENAVNPDRRRGIVKEEPPRHYIDLDIYGDSAWYKLPHRWDDAIAQYTEDTLQKYGIVPWHIQFIKYRLTKAFENKNVRDILRLSADLGHYIGDGNVPLHTTENYNGQKTNQIGIHGFWESRLPELFSDNYDYFVGHAEYEKSTKERAWQGVLEAHLALDSVLGFEKQLTEKFSQDRKYGFEQRGNVNTKVYSREFSEAYHRMLAGQVERRMRRSIKMVADFWYTCWVDGGQPDLMALISNIKPEELKDLDEDLQKSPSPNFTPRAGEEASSHHLDEVLWGCCHRESGSDVCGTVQTSEEPENIKTDSKEPQVIKSKKHSHKHVH
jgi:hypothetical protein